MRRLFVGAILSAAMVVGVGAPALAAGTGGGGAEGSGVTAAAASAVRTGVEDFTFDSYDADYTLSRADDGTSKLTTVETFVANFPDFDQNRGIIRAIPADYDGVALNPTLVSVVDADGQPVNADQSSVTGFLELALGTDDYVRGKQTYTITYTQQNVVRSFADTKSDEFYWDTNGTGFDQPFGRVSARVHVDPSLEAALTGNTACYFGPQDSTDKCEITSSTDDAGPVFSASVSDLRSRENVTVAIGFEPGTFVVPDPPQPAAWAIWVPIVVMLLTALAVIGAIVARVTAPRDAAGRGTIIPQYSVPDGVSLLVAGDVARRPGHAMAAQFVSFAVRRNVTIKDEGEDEYSLVYENNTAVTAQEQDVLAALFGASPKPGKVRQLGGTNNKVATALQKVGRRNRPFVIASGLREKSRSNSGVALMLVLVGLFVASFLMFAINLAASPVPSVPGLLVIVTGIIGLIVGVACAVRPAILTDAGAELRDYVKGLQMYMKLAEQERFRMLQSPDGALRVDVADRGQIVKLYEKLLPYAVLWGVEREWADELTIQYQDQSPSWYVGGSGYNSLVFASMVSGFTTTATSTATPTYSTSGSGGGSFSGGSGGGGFSGGGGGGGGGGGR